MFYGDNGQNTDQNSITFGFAYELVKKAIMCGGKYFGFSRFALSEREPTQKISRS